MAHYGGYGVAVLGAAGQRLEKGRSQWGSSWTNWCVIYLQLSSCAFMHLIVGRFSSWFLLVSAKKDEPKKGTRSVRFRNFSDSETPPIQKLLQLRTCASERVGAVAFAGI